MYTTTVVDDRHQSSYCPSMTLDLVGAAEVAEMLGVSRQHVSTLVRSKHDFPEPTAELAAGRIWRRQAVAEWMETHPMHVGRGQILCSFCGKNESAVAKMVAGLDLRDDAGATSGKVVICDECVALAATIIAGSSAATTG